MPRRWLRSWPAMASYWFPASRFPRRFRRDKEEDERPHARNERQGAGAGDSSQRATGPHLSLQRAVHSLLSRPRRPRRDDDRRDQGSPRPIGGTRSLLPYDERRRDSDAQGFLRDSA